MFEVGFTEIVLILGLALLVLGPEKLPGLAQKVGRWTGRARAMARQLRTQLEQEVTLDELSRSSPMKPGAPPESHREPDSSTAQTHTADSAPQDVSAQAHAETKQPEEPGLDLDRMVSGIEPEPEKTPAAAESKNVP